MTRFPSVKYKVPYLRQKAIEEHAQLLLDNLAPLGEPRTVRLLAKCPAQKDASCCIMALRPLLVFRNSENEPMEPWIHFAAVL